MSLFNKLFGPSQPPPPKSGMARDTPALRSRATDLTATAINQLNDAIEMLNKKSDYLDKQIKNELLQAKVAMRWASTRA